jgi:hypothetical protein
MSPLPVNDSFLPPLTITQVGVAWMVSSLIRSMNRSDADLGSKAVSEIPLFRKRVSIPSFVMTSFPAASALSVRSTASISGLRGRVKNALNVGNPPSGTAYSAVLTSYFLTYHPITRAMKARGKAIREISRRTARSGFSLDGPVRRTPKVTIDTIIGARLIRHEVDPQRTAQAPRRDGTINMFKTCCHRFLSPQIVTNPPLQVDRHLKKNHFRSEIGLIREGPIFIFYSALSVKP